MEAGDRRLLHQSRQEVKLTQVRVMVTVGLHAVRDDTHFWYPLYEAQSLAEGVGGSLQTAHFLPSGRFCGLTQRTSKWFPPGWFVSASFIISRGPSAETQKDACRCAVRQPCPVGRVPASVVWFSAFSWKYGHPPRQGPARPSPRCWLAFLSALGRSPGCWCQGRPGTVGISQLRLATLCGQTPLLSAA